MLANLGQFIWIGYLEQHFRVVDGSAAVKTATPYHNSIRRFNRTVKLLVLVQRVGKLSPDCRRDDGRLRQETGALPRSNVGKECADTIVVSTVGGWRVEIRLRSCLLRHRQRGS